MATKRTTAQKVTGITERIGGEVYEGYSGRCMYGARCWGITCKGSEVNDIIAAGKRANLGRVSTDNMGLDMIVYWPDAEYKPEPEPVVLSDDEKAQRLARIKLVHNARERLRKAKLARKTLGDVAAQMQRIAVAQAALDALLASPETVPAAPETVSAPVVDASIVPAVAAPVDEPTTSDAAVAAASAVLESGGSLEAQQEAACAAAAEVLEGAWGALTATPAALAAPAPVVEAPQPKAKRVVKAAQPKLPTSSYGRVGTAAELYRRSIMEGYSDEGCFNRVKQQLGDKAAGKPTYAAWYRSQLKKNGSVPPVVAPAKPKTTPGVAAACNTGDNVH
jgi:hypothetical protein